jgi:hypothetical protein
MSDKFGISSTGGIKFNKYGLGTFAGTPIKSLGVDASGNIIEFDASSGGGTTYTASEALTMTGNDIRLGGRNFHPVTVAVDSIIQFNGSGGSKWSEGQNATLATTSGTGTALIASSQSGTSIMSMSFGSGTAGIFSSQSGIGTQISSSSNKAITATSGGTTAIDVAISNNKDSTSILPIVTLLRTTADGAAKNNSGLSIPFSMQNNKYYPNQGVVQTGEISNYFTNADSSALAASIGFKTLYNNSLSTKLTIKGNGQVVLAIVQEYADNAAAVAAGLEVGTIYRTGDAMKIVH